MPLDSSSQLTTIEMTQNTHLHPSISVTYPPIIGPTIGPRMVPTDQIDTALPLFSRGMRSAMVPEPIVMVATPANPDRKRNPRSMDWLRDRAQPTVKHRKSTLVTL